MKSKGKKNEELEHLKKDLTDAKNLFVTDGACMASSSCVNPSLTYMALTARACDYAVNQMKRGEL